MVKAVTGEETRLNSVEDSLSRSGVASQVGLVIGKLSATLDRGFVFDLIPTPKNDAGDSACSILEAKENKRKTSKAKSQSPDTSSMVIDTEWVAEHARQVARMLLGGMNVIGIYVWATDSICKNSSMVLCQTIKVVAEAAWQSDSDSDEGLLIHISYSPRKWNCRSCSLSSNITTSSLRPCDFKMGKLLSSLRRFRCNYNFDISLRIRADMRNLRDNKHLDVVVGLPICESDASSTSTLSDVLHREIKSHSKALSDAKAMVDGELVVGDEANLKNGEHEIEFLLPFKKDTYSVCGIKEVSSTILFIGSLCSYSYLNPKEPVSQAVSDMKADIIRSLQSRLDILSDMDDVGSSVVDERVGTESERGVLKLVLGSCRKSYSLPFPRRVLIPWLAGTFICDYLQPAESFEVIKDHCSELLSMETLPDSSDFFELEGGASSTTARSFWDAVVPPASVTKKMFSSRNTDERARIESSSKSWKTNLGVVFALLFLAISIAIQIWLRFIA